MLKNKLMKKLLIILIPVLFINMACSQTIIDMASNRDNKHLEKGQYYIKDIGNYRDPYVGTWKYVNGNQEFRITLTKVDKHRFLLTDSNIDYYMDALNLTYQKFQNGSLIYGSGNKYNPDGIIKEFGKLFMSFQDYERYSEVFPLKLTLIPQSNGSYKMNFKLDMFEQRNQYVEDNPGASFFSVPNDIIMTKM